MASDLTTHQIERLKSIRHLLVDMDGVLCHGSAPDEGLRVFFDFARSKHIGVMLVSNDSSRSAADFVARFRQMGVDELTERDVLPMCDIVGDYLLRSATPGARMFVIGGSGLLEAIRQRGFLISNGLADGADYVVVGTDHLLTYEKLLIGTLLVRGGATLIGTNRDRTAPTEHGIGPGNGATLAYLYASTERLPLVLGKPEPEVFTQALARLGATPAQTAMVGDRLDTDIMGGSQSGLLTILVLSGVHKCSDIERLDIHPDLVFDNLAHLVRVWSAL
jgi:4-nitrophenyl phosphatase